MKDRVLRLSQPSGAVMTTSSKTRLVSVAVVTTMARSLVLVRSSVDVTEAALVER